MGLALEKLPDWPAALTRAEALSYARVAEAQLREWERTGKVHFLPKGPNGAMIARTIELDAALADLFTDASGGSMDFG